LLFTVAEFHDKVKHQLEGLVSDLQDNTGRYGDDEANAWRNSLPAVSRALSNPSFSTLHLYFGGKGKLSLEYRLPSSSSWCDMVLLGGHKGNPAAVIIELKDWTTRTDKPGIVEGLMARHTGNALHPCDQVRGYVEYCRRFHSAVLENQAQVHGCAVFTRDIFCKSYGEPPNHDLVCKYPFFTLSDLDVQQTIPAYFAERLTLQDPAFAEAFENGHYKQDRSFCRHIAGQIENPSTSPFELLDGQRRAFAHCNATIKSNILGSVMEGRLPKKKVIIIDGPPGSGKSIVAAKIWASILLEGSLPKGNVVFTTTSASQSSNWIALFREAAGERGGGGVVIKANKYMPITTHEVGKIRKKHGDVFKDASEWKKNLDLISKYRNGGFRVQDNTFLVSVVDEAHALINPEHSDARGQFGFAVLAGPQAYHIIRASVISVFFLDSEQSFRERETTSVKDIRTWASELGAGEVEEISLAGNQFRCAGSKEYVDWLEAVLNEKSLQQVQAYARQWNRLPSVKGHIGKATRNPKGLDFRIVDTPAHLDAALRAQIRNGYTARLMASYSRKWKTKGVNSPHYLPDEQKDFYEAYLEDGLAKYWSRIWNYVLNGDDYTGFIQARKGTPMSQDQLCEVGCPYAVRGFDFDYVGILWLEDLKWRSGQWIIDTSRVFESGLAHHISRAKKEKMSDGPAHRELKRKIIQGYRILLTRAMRGLYIWFKDRETREHVESCLMMESNCGPS
jgi:uncharacterized protein